MLMIHFFGVVLPANRDLCCSHFVQWNCKISIYVFLIPKKTKWRLCFPSFEHQCSLHQQVGTDIVVLYRSSDLDICNEKNIIQLHLLYVITFLVLAAAVFRGFEQFRISSFWRNLYYLLYYSFTKIYYSPGKAAVNNWRRTGILGLSLYFIGCSLLRLTHVPVT